MVLDPGPYQGLRHYEAADAPRFFGRDVESPRWRRWCWATG